MVQEFEFIKVVIPHNRGLILFARHLGQDNDFLIYEGSMLRDLPVYKDSHSVHDENGNIRTDIFIFRPSDMDRLFDKSFREGERVMLTIPIA